MTDDTVQDPLIGNLQNEASNFASEFVPDTPQGSPAAKVSRGELTPGQGVRQQADELLSGKGYDPTKTAEMAAYSAPILGEALSARDAYRSMQDRDWSNAALSAVGTVPLLGGIFGGARGAEALAQAGRPAAKDAMALAGKLKAEGATPDQIWKQTSDYIAPHEPDFAGVHYGADEKPRFEISDYDSKLSGMKYIPSTEEFHFNDIDHPDYQAAYGDKSGFPDYFMTGRIGEHVEPGASYVEPSEMGFSLMRVDANSPQGAKESALHELTHHIQNKEGFAPGANPSMAPFPEGGEGGAWPYFKEILADAITPMGFNEYLAKSKYNPDQIDTAKKDYSQYLAALNDISTTGVVPKKLNDSLMATAQYDWYRRNRGEVEAENVAHRARMTPEQRRMIPPYRTQEFPNEQQTIREMSDDDSVNRKAKGGEVSEHALPDWVKPYFAAGLRAHARGEHFYGGTPQYEEELAAFKQAHEPEAPVAPTAPEGYADGGNVTSMGKTISSDNSPHSDEIYDADSYLKGRGKVVPLGPNWGRQSPDAKTFPKPVDWQRELPTKRTWYGAPTGEKHEDRLSEEPQFKHGGKVETKKLGAIGDAFEKKLEAKHRVIEALEKRLAKHPNAKLNAKLAKEKDEARRIQEHIAKVKSFN